MHFDLIDLGVFVNAVDTGSLTAGATRSNLALAAASARMRSLELRLGVALLERNRHGVRPTAAGTAMLRHARLILAQSQQLEADLAEYSCGKKGHLRLLSNTNALAEFLPRSLGRFLAAHPDIDVAVEERPSHEIVAAIVDGEADIGIIAGTPDTSRSLQTFHFGSDHLVLVAPAASELAEGPIDLSRVLDHPFIGLRKGSAIQRYLNEIASKSGRRLNLRMQLLSFDAVCRMVENGAGLAIVPESAARRCAATMAIVWHPLNDRWARRDLRIGVRDQAALPPLAKMLLDHLRGAAAAPSDK